MKLAIHQPQYMPWCGYFHKMAGADMFVLLDDVQFKKNEWQHRNRIRNSQGWQWLSVPTAYKFPQKILEVIVRQEVPWEKNHLRSLEICYAHARFFAEYIDMFKSYFACRRPTMDRVAIDSVKLLAACLGISTPVDISSAYGFAGSASERLVNICRHFGADTYLAGAGGRDYMDMAVFESARIRVEFQEFKCPAYNQHWSIASEDFIPGLSAIDLIFNCGPDSLNVLKGTT